MGTVIDGSAGSSISISGSNVGSPGIAGNDGIVGGNAGIGGERLGSDGKSISIPRSIIGNPGSVGSEGIVGGNTGIGIPGMVSGMGKLHLLTLLSYLSCTHCDLSAAHSKGLPPDPIAGGPLGPVPVG